MQRRHRTPTISTPVPTGPTADWLRHPTGAITWVGTDHALVARRSADDEIDIAAIERETAGDRERYLARIAKQIGARDRVLIMGPDALRTELEREYVAIYHRPDRLVDVEPATEPSEAELVARLRELSA